MKNILSIFFLLSLWCCTDSYAQAQDANCAGGTSGTPTYTGTLFFNYGSVSGAYNNKNRHSSSIGEPLVGLFFDQHYFGAAGFWSRFLGPPTAPTVVATQGDLLDRIQLNWAVDPLTPSFDNGFNLYRDGIFLASVDKNTRSYNDFNVIAGRPYNYEVRGVNLYGEGVAGKALGFQVPNGVVTGLVETINGSPVPGALVTLTPMQGFSAKFDAGAGAFAMADTSTGTLLPANSPWTITCWIKTGAAAANARVLQFAPYALYFQAVTSASGQEGVIVNAPGVSAGALTVNFPASSKNDWHHLALAYANGQAQLFLDGVLAKISPMTAIAAPVTELTLGARTANAGWQGWMDELRIYDRKLDELDLGDIMEGTASSATPNLRSYWKMDEEQGTRSFDLIRRNKLFFCGTAFDADRPPVRTSAITNNDGYYRIESASYGTGTTFLAEPSKYFYRHRALKFTRSMQDRAELPSFPLSPQATIELWVNNSSPSGNQVMLSKRWDTTNEFRVLLVQSGTENIIRVYFNGVTQDYGLLGNGYQHLAFTIDSSGTNRSVAGYKNGSPIGNFTFANVNGNWSDSTEVWLLGTRKLNAGYTAFFDGLIDEVAFYDTTLTVAQIQQHVQSSRDPQERGLRAYFAFDEGSGNRLNNSGSLLTGSGTTFGTEWSAFAPNQSTTPHVFTPVTRQVTLNPSVTSVDQVDFTDRSTVAVSGFVRYNNTDCYAKNVEILVNGERYTPAIFTDSTGKFLIDLDPGATVTLSPKFEDHVFVPSVWDLTNVVNPVAGILFTDMTARKITGQVAGGLCRLPVLENVGTPQGTICKVKVRSLDGCFERTIVLDNEEGEFAFNKLPPIAMTVAVVEHSDPLIKTAFQVQGGASVDLTRRDTVTDFLYFAPPTVEITNGLEADAPCQYPVLDQYEQRSIEIRMAEVYLGEKWYVDTAKIRVVDGIAGVIKDTTISGGKVVYKFTVGPPNPAPPYLQTMQIIGTTLSGNETSFALQALVLGIRPKENFFTTKLPELPTMVLHDPPGDGSYAYIEQGQTHCSEITTFFENENGVITHGHFDLGPKWEVAGVPTEVTIATDANFTTKIAIVNDTTLSMCRTNIQRISTGDNDLIVGSEQGGDVFMGGALNIILGLADEVVVDSNCNASVNVIVTVSPDDFATTFVYSEYHIRENIIRYLQLILDDIIADPAKPDSDTLTYRESIDRWNNILESNATRRAEAAFQRNISFDAFAVYESSETSDSSRVTESGRQVLPEGEVTEQLGTYTGGIGADLTLGYTFTQVRGSSTTTTDQNTTTTGFVLTDDDAGDAFTIDIGLDKTYGTPVFNVVNGQSNCPWEPGTAHREGNKLSFRDGSVPVAIDVPANEPAVFKLTLGNISATNEDWSYVLSTGPESNPHGAKIFLNGAPLDHPIIYAIPYGTSIPVTVTLERGPEEYDYDSLEVVLYSLCEDDRATALGIRPDDDTILYSAVYVSAHFIRPCSEVDINVPEQNWVVHPDASTPGPDDVLNITTSGYNKNDSDFEKIRVQYRRSDGDGAWINISPVSEILRANLGNTFTNFQWNTEGLSDGPYELRAVALCSGDAEDKPGYSQIIRGRIDRQPPSIVGTPQPSDGVFNTGDEISVTFNKHINCTKIFPALIGDPNNVGLYDATTGLLIDAQISCYENKITVVPNFQNQFFENHVLRLELHDIPDKTGNVMVAYNWEFFVDRNELAWLTDSIGTVKYDDESKVLTAKIHNRGGSPVPFSIQSVPSWLRVVPNAGTLVANEVRDIRFEIDSLLGIGMWTDSIVLHTETGQNPFFMGGDEVLPLGVRVICRPPMWQFDAGLHPNTMNFALKLDMEGVLSADAEDMVAAYINNELRGSARVQYVPLFDTWMAFLTVYGDPDDSDAPIDLEIWDASACLRYGDIVEQYVFQPDNLIGAADNPVVLHTSGQVLREIPLAQGWNWISFNLSLPDPAINPVLSTLLHPEDDYIKGQAQFSEYFGNAWFGSLTTLGNNSMYQYRANLPDTLKLIGALLDPATHPLSLVQGWNWISYLPNLSLPVDEALSSLTPLTGDLIKGQFGFAQYVANFGWIGNLSHLKPPQGYQLRLANAGTLTYPEADFRPVNMADTRGIPPSTAFWQVDPAAYEYSMTLIGMLALNGENATLGTEELDAFVGNELRGAAKAIYVEPLNAYLFFLTTYANTSGEQVHFKLYDATSGQVSDLQEQFWFAADLHQGSIQSPIPFHLQSTGVGELHTDQYLQVDPNPFREETRIWFSSAQSEEVQLSITDVQGRILLQQPVSAVAGMNSFHWRSDATVTPGVYFVRLETSDGVAIRKVVRE